MRIYGPSLHEGFREQGLELCTPVVSCRWLLEFFVMAHGDFMGLYGGQIERDQQPE